MENDFDENSSDWKGKSLSEIYDNKGPWQYTTYPIFPSKYHTVLYQLPAKLNEQPNPHFNAQQTWDDDHVKMPFSSKNLFPVKNGNEVTLKYRWDLINEILLQPISNSRELEEAISTYNHKLPKFLALHHFFEEVLEEYESKHFFLSVLPGIIRLALRLPELIPGNIPLLKRGTCKSISLSQLQVASILANGFLCTFPWKKEMALYPGINFTRLFAAHLRPRRENAVSEKLKCICHYFRRILAKEPCGVVTFERKFIPKSHLPRWDRLENDLSKTKLHITSVGTIEDNGLGLLQVDFANKYVGGGVLGFGCVQEEIRYIICPELIVGRLFTEQLGSNEALIVTGVERYSNYKGYGDTFVWDGHHNDTTPYDKYARKQTSVVAIDATHFTHQMDQFSSSFILRELNKAFTGFQSRSHDILPAVATGNWGCGAFRGDPHLKSLIQLMACNAANRDMVYYTFGDEDLRDRIYYMYLFLTTNQITIVQLWRILCRFQVSKCKPENLYGYIQQTFFENKNQLSIKQFFGFKKEDMPSTSKTISSNENKMDMNDDDDNDEMDSPTIDIEIQSSPDIIENSQEENFTLNKKQKITKNIQANDIKMHNKHTEIVNLMNLLDGNSENINTTNDCSDDINISTILDSFSRKQTTESRLQDHVQLENLEIQEILPTDTSNVDIGIKNKSKITDYFNKISK